jgi:DNA-binding NarL/FixJ family response regulator
LQSDIHLISVVVCDPCPLIFFGMQKCFEADLRVKVSAKAADLQHLHRKVQSTFYNVAIIDWSMIAWQDQESPHLLREIARHTKVVLLGMSENTRERKRALEMGVRGIISKKSPAAQIRKAMLKVAGGGVWLEASAAETLLDHVFSPPADASGEAELLKLITPREHGIIELVCRGLRNKQIAAELSISETTVWHHLTSIFGKLRVSDRVALVTFAFRHEMQSAVSHRPKGNHSVPIPGVPYRSSQVAS